MNGFLGDIDDSTNATGDEFHGSSFFLDDEEEHEEIKEKLKKQKTNKRKSDTTSAGASATIDGEDAAPKAKKVVQTFPKSAERKSEETKTVIEEEESEEEQEQQDDTTKTKKKKEKKTKKLRKKVAMEDLPPISESDKIGHLKAIHRAVKKAQKLALAKVTRKRKDEPANEAALSQDLAFYKAFDIDALSSQAWNLYELKQKPVFDDSLSGRARELAQLLLHAPSVKSAFEAMTQKRIREHQHKQYLKNKKKTAKEEAKATDKPAEKGDAKLLERLHKLREGEVVQGIVDGVEPFGVFLDFWAKKQRYRGLIHISEVTGEKIERLQDYFDIGDPVRAVVLKIDKETLRVSLTLQKKYYPAGDPGWSVGSQRFQKSDGKIVSRTFSSVSSSSSSQTDNASNNNNTESTFVTSLKSSAPMSELTEKKRKKSQLVKLLEMAKGVSKKRMGQRQRQELLTDLYGEAGEQPKPSKQKSKDPNAVVTPRKPFKPIGRAEQKRQKRLRESGGALPASSTSPLAPATSSTSLSTSLTSSSLPPPPLAAASSTTEKKPKPQATHAASSPATERGAKRQKLGNQQQHTPKQTSHTKPIKGDKTNNFKNDRQKNNQQNKHIPQQDEDTNIHPSWAAKRQAVIPEFKGKRVVFD